MSQMLKGIDLRTQMVGANRLELLLFNLNGRQTFGINVFKVQEVIRCPNLTKVANSHPTIVGIANMRDKTIPVIDLARALKMPATPKQDYNACYVVVADYNRKTQGFLVKGVQRIVNMNWSEILPPPKGAAGSSYFTAVTKVDNQLIGILDVEKVLEEVTGTADREEYVADERAKGFDKIKILVVDDSSVARNQIKRTLEKLNISCALATDGQDGLKYLEEQCKNGTIGELDLIITDVEMPNMDGYTLTTRIRQHPQLKDLYVIMHTSLSGVFNQIMVEKVGANKFIPKFNQRELAEAIIEGVESTMQLKKAG
ncbi:MAG: chemotaxis protein CheV [Gammaproteobacteria bacterium]|nr:chemotaxis protein CheV [Gammaproteobacteria bacterium]MDH5800514.1 chemotaxis protein CheV [Gammaproteobacteria bacterium]